MDLIKAYELAKELISKHCPDYTFQFDNARVRFGCCSFNKKIISLSKYLTFLNEEEKVKDTLLHEIAHALTPRQHHNHIWRAKAIELGCNGERCYNDDNVKYVKGKFVYECPNCKREIRYHRRKKVKTACGVCCEKYNNGRYTEQYKIKFLGVIQ